LGWMILGFPYQGSALSFPVIPQVQTSTGNEQLPGSLSDEVLSAFRKRLSVDTNDPIFWVCIGIRLSQLGRHGEALQAYDRALLLDPHHPDARNCKAVTLIMAGRNKGIFVPFDQKQSTGHPVSNSNDLIHLMIINHLMEGFQFSLHMLSQQSKMGDTWAKMVKSFSEQGGATSEESSDVFAVWSCKGTILGSLGFYEEAVKSLDLALSFHSHDPLTYYNKGKALAALQRYEQALAAYEEALRLDPNNQMVATARKVVFQALHSDQ